MESLRSRRTRFATAWCFEICSRVLRDLRISNSVQPIARFGDIYYRLVHFLGQELEMTLHRRRRAATGIEHLSSVFQAESPAFEAQIEPIAEEFSLAVIRAVIHVHVVATRQMPLEDGVHRCVA